MAAVLGTAVFIGKSGKTYTVDIQVPDAVASMVTWNPSGLAAATSTDYWKAPEDCILVDVSVAGAPTAVGASLTQSGAVYTGNTLRWANQSNALATRMKLKVPFSIGDQVGMLQY